MNSNFPFADAPNTACFTCCHVLNDNEPILYISHDEDGYWQFLCGGQHQEDDARIISLSTVLKIDERIGGLAKLSYGEYAERKNAKNDWIVRHKEK